MSSSEIDILLGQRIKELRERRGLSLSEVATKLKMSKSSIHGYEKGKVRIYWDVLIQLCKIYDVDYGKFADSVQKEYNSLYASKL